jgi:glycosyltransferase involved in cell wall biosynthesis
MSQSTADSLQKERNLPSAKIRPMDLGIRLPLSESLSTKSETRTQLGIPGNAVVVGMVGRFDWYKGHRYLLEAMHQVIDSGAGDNLWVLLVGAGDELNNMKALAHDLHLSDRIVFTGFYPDALVAMRACDIMTMLSVGYEGQGYVILEAMALSRPVIACNIRGLKEVVEDGETGLLVPPANSQVLANALRQLIHNEPQRLSMGRAGRRCFEERFTLDRMLANTQSLYKEILVGRS